MERTPTCDVRRRLAFGQAEREIRELRKDGEKETDRVPSVVAICTWNECTWKTK